MTAPWHLVLGTAAVAAYGLSAALYLAYLRRRLYGLVALGLTLGVAGWFAQTGWLALWLRETGRLPIGSVQESLALYAWLFVALALVRHQLLRQPVYGAALVPLGFLAGVLGGCAAPDAGTLAPILATGYPPGGWWLPLHVLASIVAYGALTLACVAAVLYLIGLRRLKRRSPSVLDSLIPPLAVAERAVDRLMVAGFPFMTLTIVSGALWAVGAWGAPWQWDPKQTMALATWLVWAVFFLARHGGWRGRRAAWLVVAGFLSSLILFLGVGVLTPSLHAFG